ncbi:MAG TPA: hypothetical protein VMX54_08515 [Vicinamibacteria bacterium]|nr:hypothetical protein [Vicinamibacteria bacterium]
MGWFSIAYFVIAWAVLNGLVASEKGRQAGAAVALSIVCTPMLVYLYLLAVPSKLGVGVVSSTAARASAGAGVGAVAPASQYVKCECGFENWHGYTECQKCGNALR